MNKLNKITNWASALTDEQKTKLLAELVDYLIESEEICFCEDPDKITPYWYDGNPLVPGQKIFVD